MRIHLITKPNSYVIAADIPCFYPPPPVVVYGSRVFRRLALDNPPGLHVKADEEVAPGDPQCIYRECVGYFINALEVRMSPPLHVRD